MGKRLCDAPDTLTNLAPSPSTGRAGVGSDKDPPKSPRKRGEKRLSYRGTEDSVAATRIKAANDNVVGMVLLPFTLLQET